jgi:hypothetical protein
MTGCSGTLPNRAHAPSSAPSQDKIHSSEGELWQDNLRSLTEGDGSAIIRQDQVDAIESFLNNLSVVSSTALQQIIAAELQRLGPLDDDVDITMFEAKRQAISDIAIYLPLTIR